MFVIFAQIFSFLLAAVVISKSYVDLKARRESVPMFVFWTVTWTVIVVVAVFPTLIDIAITAFGGGRAGLGTFLGMALVFLYFVVYRLYTKLERTEHNLTKTIQDIALKDDWSHKN